VPELQRAASEAENSLKGQIVVISGEIAAIRQQAGERADAAAVKAASDAILVQG